MLHLNPTVLVAQPSVEWREHGQFNASACVVASSICDMTGARVDTLQLRYPRMVHADFMTHRNKSRNASSSRAIPLESLLVRDADTYVPTFRKNQRGMQPGEHLSPDDQAKAARIWLELANLTRDYVRILADPKGLNIHKQWVNRPLEWFGYIDVLATASNWTNFDRLRNHTDAQDEIRFVALAAKEARLSARPRILKPGEWHLPYVTEADEDYAKFLCRGYDRDLPPQFAELERAFGSVFWHLKAVTRLLLIVSTARSCRVSYSKHDGSPSTIEEDAQRFGKLLSEPLHASPFEHQCTPMRAFDDGGLYPDGLEGNLKGFVQFRKGVPGEAA